MHIRLTQPGWETYTGQVGVIDFVDGLSTDDVSTKDATRLAAVVNCKWEESEKPVSPTELLLHVQNVEAPIIPERERGEDEQVVSEPVEPQATQEPEVPAVQVPKISMDKVEALIAAEGINGLRKLAEPLGIKGRSVADLLAALERVGAIEKAKTE